MPLKVYLGDLRYNYSGVLANDCMPLSVAYLKAVMDRDHAPDDVQSRLFAYPGTLLDAMKEDPPDVLMLSNYVWNEALSHKFLKIARELNPQVLTVMGGPNISIEPERQLAYLKANPHLDIYALGEADFLASHIISLYSDVGRSRSRLAAQGVPSSVYRSGDGGVQINLMRPRHKEVEEIPSPWLSGIQDEFFDGKLAPMIETNRGCPFTCTFCVQGTNHYTKVHNFGVERIKEEIHYIAKRIRERSPGMYILRIADSNYGMFERDIEISGFIGEMQRDYGWPTFIDATTGKNRPERIIKSVEKVSGALVLYQAVQSLDENVLRNVKRQTIKLEAYKALEIHMRGRGLKSNSDLILGLPGETLESHVRGLRTLLDSNIHQMHNFQAMMLKGAELETAESRRLFAFETRFRALPKNFGVYDGHTVIDAEEIIVATDTLPFEDYLTARKLHLVSSVFWNNGWFDPLVRFVREQGIANSEWWSGLLPAMENGPPGIRSFLDSFVAETVGELFPTKESCVEFYSQAENFRKLENGEIGDNLMYRYRAIAAFHAWPEVCAIAMQATRNLLIERGLTARFEHFDEFWAEFEVFIRLSHAAGRTRAQILATESAELRYDFPAWLAGEKLTDFGQYRLSSPCTFVFGLNDDYRRELEQSLSVWTTEIKGLSKLVTRIRPEAQTRDCSVRMAAIAG